MTSAIIPDPIRVTRSEYLRPIKLALIFSILGEAFIFIVWGVVLFPEGNIINKFFWTIVFCGVGMGGALGSAVAMFVVNRAKGVSAIIQTIFLSLIMLGIACNYLCLRLDRVFHYFGGAEDTLLFLGNGLVMSAVGGALLGYLCFTERGRLIGNDVL